MNDDDQINEGVTDDLEPIYLVQVTAYVPQGKLAPIAEITSRMLTGLAMEQLSGTMSIQPVHQVDPRELLAGLLGDDEEPDE